LNDLLKNNITTIGIENINENGEYLFLIPYEQIKGRFAVNTAAYFLGGAIAESMGKTISPINFNHERANFLIVNASYAGYEAIRTALALGANVTLLENNELMIKTIKDDQVFRSLTNLYHSSLNVEKADFESLVKNTSECDVLINTNSDPATLTAKRITNQMIKSMKSGAVCIDLAADQGFGIEAIRKQMTAKKPYMVVDKTIIYAMDNIPSLFANSSSIATSHISADYLLSILENDKM